jgi:hypothetical protein
MVGKTKTCISRYLGGLGGESGVVVHSCWNMVPFWLSIVNVSFEKRMKISLICFVIC